MPADHPSKSIQGAMTTICNIPGKGSWVFVPDNRGLRLILASAPQKVSIPAGIQGMAMLHKSIQNQLKPPRLTAVTNVRDGRIQKRTANRKIPPSIPRSELLRKKVPAVCKSSH